MRTGERRHDDSGMSLVEIVIAMLLFGLLAIGVLPLMWGITQSSVHNRELLTATTFAKDKVAAIQADTTRVAAWLAAGALVIGVLIAKSF